MTPFALIVGSVAIHLPSTSSQNQMSKQLVVGSPQDVINLYVNTQTINITDHCTML